MARAKKISTTQSRAKSRFKTLKKSGEIKDVKGLIAEGGFKKYNSDRVIKGTGRKGKVKRRDVKAALLADEKKQYLDRRGKEQEARDKDTAVKKAAADVKKESSVATSKDMATEKSNRSVERQASMQSKTDEANKKRKESDIVSKNNARIRGNISRRKDAGGGEYEFKEKDGTTARRRALTPEEIAKAKKEGKLNYGGSVKVIKKAKAGASLKSVPSKAKGLSKLPKGVRNKMGYMQEGGKVKSKSVGVLKSDTNKAGPKMEQGKEPYTKNGINYTWDRKNSVWVGDVKGNEGVGKKSRAVKKTKK